ncbi:RTA1 like protein-domain-containing protein [Podospora didyma]|uniref:RTA1 like protein-domain-containing protein n=1 Tax=Podospora didyma TaxID=330526 RepID=A0AAE0U8N4_9PEZI|nr:RTA1 like protein-domain-containing protein [Podospora didyma]
MAGDCTANTCPTPGGFVSWQPALAGNAVMIAAFSALIPVNIYTAIRYRTITYTSPLIVGLFLEIVGHAGKLLLQSNPASRSRFFVFMLGTVWGPTFVGAALCNVIPHVLVIYGQEFRLVSRPILISIAFVVLDIFALAFTSVGIAFATNANTETETGQGVYILLTGLGLQFLSLAIFLGTYHYFRLRLSRRHYVFDPTFSTVFLSSRFNVFLLCAQIAAALLLVRAAVRIGSFTGGLGSSLAQSQTAVFLLDDALVLVATIILSAVPAGRAFGKAWAGTAPAPSSLRGIRSKKRARPAISQPNPANTIFAPPQPPRSTFSPRSARLPNITRPLISPRQTLSSRQHVPYEVSFNQTAPYMSPVRSAHYMPSGLSSPGSSSFLASPKPTAWHSTTPTAPTASRLVNPDTIWA